MPRSKNQQRPAFRWQDIFTIPNAMSLTGAALSWKGVEKLEEPKGLAQLIIGRSIDAVDGQVARALGQESNFGATVDAGLDKLATAKIMWELNQKNAAPKKVLGTIALLSAINFATTAKFMVDHPGEPIRPTKSGKLAMAAETVALFAYSAGYTAEQTGKVNTAKVLKNIGNAAFVAALPAAIHSTAHYVKRCE